MATTVDAALDPIDALFVVLDGTVIEDAPVLQSQVGEQLLVLQRAGIRSGLIATTRDASRFDALLGDRLRAAGVDVTLVRHRGRVANVIVVTAAFRAVTRRRPVRAAYARGIWGPVAIRLSSWKAPLRYVYDIRGVVGDETLAAGSRGARAKSAVYDALERWCVRRAWRVTTVSRALADELRRTCGRGDVIVIPPCIDVTAAQTSADDVQSVRDELGFSRDDVVVVYSGGVDRHQAIPRMLEIWQALAARPGVRFLLLTKSKQLSTDALADVPRLAGRVVLRSVPRGAVARYLAACDLGFILREPRRMNRVASPVKFAEYAAAGLAVVASPNIGDVSSSIIESRIGAIVDAADLESTIDALAALLDDLRRNRDAIRRRARELAAAKYNWAAYVPAYRALYEIANTGGGK